MKGCQNYRMLRWPGCDGCSDFDEAVIRPQEMNLEPAYQLDLAHAKPRVEDERRLRLEWSAHVL
jgi:hypothetical protein